MGRRYFGVALRFLAFDEFFHLCKQVLPQTAAWIPLCAGLAQDVKERYNHVLVVRGFERRFVLDRVEPLLDNWVVTEVGHDRTRDELLVGPHGTVVAVHIVVYVRLLIDALVWVDIQGHLTAGVVAEDDHDRVIGVFPNVVVYTTELVIRILKDCRIPVVAPIDVVQVGTTDADVERLILLIIVEAAEVFVGINVSVETENRLPAVSNPLVEKVVEHLTAEPVVGPVLLLLGIVLDLHHICLFLRWVEVVYLIKPHRELFYEVGAINHLLPTEHVVLVLVRLETTWPQNQIVVPEIFELAGYVIHVVVVAGDHIDAV